MNIKISKELKELLNLNDYLMDNFDDYDEYYNAYVCLNDNDILHAKDDFYFNGSANFVIAPKKLIKKYYGEQSREDFNNLLEFSSYSNYDYIEKFKNNLYNAFEIDIPENMDKTDEENFENALIMVENGYYLKKENCYILDF